MNQLMDTKKLDGLVRNRNYDEALKLCNLMLEETGVDQYRDLLRKRSHIHSLLGDYQQAIDDRLELIEQDQGEADVFCYFIFVQGWAIQGGISNGEYGGCRIVWHAYPLR